VPVITLTTDFGAGDWFVGAMKGVILEINPRTTIVDISHGITAGEIRAGAFALASSFRFFPKGTVHVAVVDPGVGSRRRGIVVETARYSFVGPDNGVLSWALAQERIKGIHALENEAFFRRPVSQTFHGRDIFGPVAAHLSLGLAPGKLGPRTKKLVRLPWPQTRVSKGRIDGEILHIDGFGNAITNLDVKALAGNRWDVFLGRRRICRVERFYQAVAPGRPVAVPGSTGFLEIAVNGGNAARKLGLRIGVRVSLRTRH
jgi:S-adenosylmethionine hydrolase